MGICWTSSDSPQIRSTINVDNSFHRELSKGSKSPYKPKISKKSLTKTEFSSTFSIPCEGDLMRSSKLTQIISNNSSKLKVAKINFEQLYNIYLTYRNDFTTCAYILLETRKGSAEKRESFLKRFRQVNYSVKQLALLSCAKLDNFFRYVDGKNVIVVLKDERSLEVFENYYNFLLTNLDKINTNVNFLILNHNFNDVKAKNEENIAITNYNDLLYHYVSKDNLIDNLPNILLNTKDIQDNAGLKNKSSFLFVRTFSYNHNESNPFNINNLVTDTNFVNEFISDFKISSSFNFISQENPKEFVIKYIKSLKKKDKNKFNEFNIFIAKEENICDYLGKCRDKFEVILDEIYREMQVENNIVIQIDVNLDKKNIIKILLFLIHYSTNLPFSSILQYLREKKLFIFEDISYVTQIDFFEDNMGNIIKEFEHILET